MPAYSEDRHARLAAHAGHGAGRMRDLGVDRRISLRRRIVSVAGLAAGFCHQNFLMAAGPHSINRQAYKGPIDKLGQVFILFPLTAAGTLPRPTAYTHPVPIQVS